MEDQRLAILLDTMEHGAEVQVAEAGYEWRKGLMRRPHSSAEEHEEELWSSIWKDSMRGGALILPGKEAGDLVKGVEFALTLRACR